MSQIRINWPEPPPQLRRRGPARPSDNDGDSDPDAGPAHPFRRYHSRPGVGPRDLDRRARPPRGREALGCGLDNRYSAILMDVMIPAPDGVAVVRR